METLVIIPSYNEAENIERLVCSIYSLNTREISVLIVDDSSPDGTGDIADRLASRFSGKVFVLHRPQKSGLGSAYRMDSANRLSIQQKKIENGKVRIGL